MNRPEITITPARNWRDIPQEVKPRAMSPEGRRRVWWKSLRTIVAVTVVAGLAWAGYQVGSALRGKPKPIAREAEVVPVKEVVLITDGVLDQNWLVKTLALPPKISLMELDLYRLRARLLESGQVRSATLTRNFPATLTVTLSENSPVARVMAQIGDEPPHMFLVAREGGVFDGVGFDRGMVDTLPWLDGVKLARAGGGFAPIASMEKVADLLGKAKLEAEHLYRTWQVVSLARLESDGEIEVKAQAIGRIVFGTREDFFRQLARLDTLIDTARAKTDQPIREINLAIGAQVPVAFEEPVLLPGTTSRDGTRAAGAGATAARTLFTPASPNLQRKSKL